MAGARSTVLVVDDDPVALQLVQVTFELEGFDVLTAVDGAAAVDLARTRRPEAVVAAEAGVDGASVVAALRQERATAAIPVVLLSGDARRGARSGADDYVTKPFEPVDLVTRVRRLLGRGEPAPPQR